MLATMPIKPLNLTLESELIEEIKIQAVREARSVSDIARDLFREYLDRQVKVKVKAKSK
jgi:plasmid stability protein